VIMARKKLLELKWHPKKTLEGIKLSYLHRGAPGDKITINSEEIVDLEKSFFVLMRRGEETRIPYHRILELTKEDEVIWKKKR